MKILLKSLAAISFIVPTLVFADVTIVVPTQNNTDQTTTTTTTSDTYVQPVEPYVGVAPVGGAAAVYGTGVNGVRRPNEFNNNEFDHKAAGAAGLHEQQNGVGRAGDRGVGERGGRR